MATITRQLFELQELDNDIENTRQTLDLKNHQLGNKDVLTQANSLLSAEQKALDDLKKQRKEAETEVADVTAKINDANKQLYGGRVSNPKELSSIQAEVAQLTRQRDQYETSTLETIDKLEESENKVKTLTAEYQKLEETWAAEQGQLAKDIELLTKTLAGLQESRREAASHIDAATTTLYERLRKQKKQAVAKVEQGICKACRLSLSASSLQRARGGQPVQCGTCGRILFIA